MDYIALFRFLCVFLCPSISVYPTCPVCFSLHLFPSLPVCISFFDCLSSFVPPACYLSFHVPLFLFISPKACPTLSLSHNLSQCRFFYLHLSPYLPLSFFHSLSPSLCLYLSLCVAQQLVFKNDVDQSMKKGFADDREGAAISSRMERRRCAGHRSCRRPCSSGRAGSPRDGRILQRRSRVRRAGSRCDRRDLGENQHWSAGHSCQKSQEYGFWSPGASVP